MKINRAKVYANGIEIDTVAMNGAARGRVKNGTEYAYRHGFVVTVNGIARKVIKVNGRNYIRL